MKLHTLVDEFAQRFGFGRLAPDELGQYAVGFEGELNVTIRPLDSSRFALLAPLGSPPEDSYLADQWYRRALQMSLARLHAQPETLATEAATGQLLMYRTGNADQLEQGEFDDWMESFVNGLEFWQNILRGESRSPLFPSTKFF